MSVFSGLRESFRLPDLRRRILITLLLLVIYRLASNIPVPGVDHEQLAQLLSPQSGSGVGAFAQVLDLLSGGAVSRFSVLAMGVYPYITASIIIQILTPLVPALEDIAREGQSGRDKINRLTYYISIPLAAFQAIAQVNILGAGSAQVIIPGFGFGANADILMTFAVLSIMTAGTMFAIWLGELITEDGIGNGLSLIIFAGIVARVPAGLISSVRQSATTVAAIRNMVIFLILTVLTMVVIVLVQEGQRRLPVKYGKRVRGMKMYGGGSTYLPLRINTAGMIPLIFANAFMSFPAIIANFFTSNPTGFGNFAASVSTIFGSQGGTSLGGQIAYWVMYFLLVVGFTYLYTDIMIRNQGLADNLQRNGGFIPGIRPGKRTEEFINKVVSRITLVGAMFLGVIAVLPGVVQIVMDQIQPGSGLEIRSALYIISGGGMIIVAGVVIDTMRQLEAQLVMRNRETFIR